MFISADCSGLTSVTIGNSVTSIGNYAFSNCTLLKDVFCCAESAPEAESTAFDLANIESATLHVPAASIESYKTTEPWSNFGSIVPLTDEEMTAISSPTATGTPLSVPDQIFTLGGGKVDTLQKGINIIRMSDGTVKKVWVK